MTSPHVSAATARPRRALLLSTAISALAAGATLPWLTAPAAAACVITGGGSQTALQSGDSITCTGAGNTLVKTAPGVSGVTANIGDGTATSVNDPAFAGVIFEAASNGAINVSANASVTSANSDGIALVSGSNNNVIAIDAGAVVGSSSVGATGLALSNSSNNIVVIGGTVGSAAPLTSGIGIGTGAASNQVNILLGGVVQSSNVGAIDLNGAGAGNTIDNAGTISSASGAAILGSANQDSVINSGTIMTGASTAVDLKDGDDIFALHAGSTITGAVLGGNGTDTLRFGGTADSSFDLGTFGAAQQFREFEALEKTGSSTWTLTGSTTDTATMNVQAGILIVSGAMPNVATTVGSGGTIGGDGAIGDLTVLSGGRVAPGGFGSLTAYGNATFNAGSAYAISVNAAGQSDKISAVGATLNGGTVAVTTLAGAYAPSTQYTILSTTMGLTGSFANVTLSGYNPQFFTSALSYDGFSVFLTLNYNTAVFQSVAQTQNQKAVAGALSAFGPNLPFLASFAGQSDAQLRTSMDQLSGEAATGAQQGAFQFTGQFLGLMLDPFVSGRGTLGSATGDTVLGFNPARAPFPHDIALAYNKVLGAPAAPTFAERWTAWGTAFGGANRTGGDALVIGSHDLSARAGGVAAGADYHVSRDAIVGFALSGGGTKWDLAQALGGGKSDALQAGVYTALRAGPAYFAASLAVANHWMSTDRLAPFGNQLTAKFNAQTFGGRIEGGYRFATPIGGFTPYAAAQAQAFRTPTYAEVDLAGGGLGLTYQGRTASGTRSELGARFDRATLIAPNAVLTLRGRAAWAHDWVSDPALLAAFQGLPTASFIVNGATPAKDAALASAGAELKFSNGVSLSAKFDGEFAARSTTYSGTASLRYAW
ncbi:MULTISPECIES: autotransporter outer membrane beta-barrel domain-containing protein [unclassified Bradyrhizobium]|uniref:autotransporter outer membrane beta-barrel domain-containing protein n=1 Tax=unclassified Bradyrhizobium TaxID=2631580 RepID=UPI00211E8AC0|nr:MULTISPECIES: autotransporter domain-containing protein [unclassified Bradyrhizobium]MDD1532428.1 autotransporter outer membrane beta-barrel domain-containing protein [Bradyrhizobium sp. WBOS8]MDD1582432.1 autotransporter outer membrane beta-barrel domain-containing protein [Bradyrhizobium sp. WBOS4]UUO50918.1 autotransporter outer membrane beta-barrel domain-containing protein [Bradyrhizobium sp. WBOS04]UUO58297.1 autotransporter outer membrane beta-barrel domain-containing protein [Bradyrh